MIHTKKSYLMPERPYIRTNVDLGSFQAGSTNTTLQKGAAFVCLTFQTRTTNDKFGHRFHIFG